MARPHRPKFANACYHVMNRGRNKQSVFPEPWLYHLFLSTLKRCRDKHNLSIHAYCLMPNHFHLMVSTPDANISECMRFLCGYYTQKYNHFLNADGALFRGRFKSKLVDTDSYALYLSRYIHRNPIDANKPLTKRPEDYPWSSMSSYVSPGSPSEWLDTELVRGIAGEAPSQYRSYVAGTDVQRPACGEYLEGWEET